MCCMPDGAGVARYSAVAAFKGAFAVPLASLTFPIPSTNVRSSPYGNVNAVILSDVKSFVEVTSFYSKESYEISQLFSLFNQHQPQIQVDIHALSSVACAVRDTRAEA